MGSSLNTLRAILVGFAVLAAIIAAIFGMWPVVGWLSLGIAAHGAMWWYLYRQRRAATVPEAPPRP